MAKKEPPPPTPEEKIIAARKRIHELLHFYTDKQLTFQQLKEQMYYVMRYQFPLETFIDPRVKAYMDDRTGLTFEEQLAKSTIMFEVMDRILEETRRK